MTSKALQAIVASHSELLNVLKHIKSAAMDITVERRSIAKAAEEAINKAEAVILRESNNG